MLIRDVVRQRESKVTGQGKEVRLVKPLQFDDHTPQTPGMLRLAAVSHDLVGSESLWAGVMLVDPGTESSVHGLGAEQGAVGEPAGARSRFGAWRLPVHPSLH